jgi:hypothetical protein
MTTGPYLNFRPGSMENLAQLPVQGLDASQNPNPLSLSVRYQHFL